MPEMEEINQEDKKRLAEFLAVAAQFHLGDLPTEQPHPLTTNLSALAKENPEEALGILHAIDSSALKVLVDSHDSIINLAHRIQVTLDSEKKIYLCGCGATGRLSLTCEFLWRMAHKGDPLENSVIAFMAGGDVALIRSIEDFEDHPEYGVRQVRELGFTDGDLLIGCTEGGETPFVIGAVAYAAEISSNHPFFLYCNPDDVLKKVAVRSAQILNDDRVEKINLTTGPMALAGSTRMQASTVLMASVGHALLGYKKPEAMGDALENLQSIWNGLHAAFLKPFIIAESSCYAHGGHLLYETDQCLAITILTDTTERSPTFSVAPFENSQDPLSPFSLCHLYLPGAPDPASAWELLLGRNPRTLEWKEIGKRASRERLDGFDFSARLPARRALVNHAVSHQVFKITNREEDMIFNLESLSQTIPMKSVVSIDRHLVLKMLLNMHSTLVMGRLGRYESNIMTWVRPSNNKLIDRTIRYVDLLLKRKGIHASYEEIAAACFSVKGRTPLDHSLVLAVVDSISSKK
jgi:N-acetylmuramic acid 6-phosphate etherase